MNYTTERFARRLGEKVRDASYASAIEQPQGRATSPCFEAFCWACAVLLLSLLVIGWLGGAEAVLRRLG